MEPLSAMRILLLDELCGGMAASRHRRVRPPAAPAPEPLEELRMEVGSHGHPDFR